jgi:alpha-methylacyl-CoA racemase
MTRKYENDSVGQGPLHGVRVVELAGLGPSPFSAMMLADMGADVIRVDRPGGATVGNPLSPRDDLLNRGRRSIAVDLKSPRGVDTVLQLCDASDILLEGFRPGVAERLGVGPEIVMARNPGIIYGRMTGWGQLGPDSLRAGHDINYLALSGALAPIGPAARPAIPINLVGDFGGGGLLLAFGVLCALTEARQSGQGQVVDAAITDGAALLTTQLHALAAQGLWSDRREDNLLDGGAYFYGVYECADGKFVSIGAIEPKFYARLLELLRLIDDSDFLEGPDRPDLWPDLRRRLEITFRSETRSHWSQVLANEDVCFAPVLSLVEAPRHPHNAARGTFIEVDGILQPAPAPRFSRSTPSPPSSPPSPGQHTRRILSDLGLGEYEIDDLLASGAVHEASAASV